ncbi:MAG: insulinase family protein [Sandaracinaceae bacterium]|nr:insulinase family protein [Sandaracinaceae bacterium]
MKKLVTISLAACVASCGGSPTPNATVGLPSIRETVSQPSARTIESVASRTESPVVSFRIVYDAGSGTDLHDGATLLAARLMTDGAAGELSYAQIQERLFPMAASVDFHVDREQTVFSARVHRDHLDAFYAIFRAMLIAPQMTEADFARVRAQTQSELTLELRGNDDEALGQETLQAMLYEGHSFGHPALGTAAALSAMTLEQVRAQRTAMMCEANLHIGLSGAFPEDFAQRIQSDLTSLTCPTVHTLPAVRAPNDQQRRI